GQEEQTTKRSGGSSGHQLPSPQTPAAEEKPIVAAAQTAPAAPLPKLDGRGEPVDSGKGSAPLALGQRHRTEVESCRRATDPPTKITYFHRRWDSGG
uniref:Uncharacterized protein n=1 Tax=Oryza barthii TaxID=65489 RepID=A0A0D3G818_9ORYZ